MSDNINLFKETEKKEDDFTIEEDIDTSTIDTSNFFEKKPEEDSSEDDSKETSEENISVTEESQEELDPLTNVPAPEKNVSDSEKIANEFLNTSKEIDEADWTGDDILAMATGVGEDGNAPARIFVSLERISGIKNGMSIDDIPDENREVVEECEIDDCTIDFFALTTEVANLVFNFKSTKAVYLKEFYEILNRYRLMQEQMTEVGTIPMLTIVIMPDDLNGRGAIIAAFPLAFFRTLNDDGVNASLHTIFHTANISFARFNMSEEAEAELVADALREIEAGANGLYQED